MNRLALITVGAVAVAAVAFTGIVISNGGRSGPSQIDAALPGATTDHADAPAERPREEAAVPETRSLGTVEPPAASGAGQSLVARVVEDAGSRATFERMAQRLRAVGVDISAMTVGTANGRILAGGFEAAAEGWPGGRLVIDRAQIEPGEGGSFTLTAVGAYTAVLTSDGTVTERPGLLSWMTVDIVAPPGSEEVTVRAVLEGLSMQGEEGRAPPLSAAKGRLSFTLTEGSALSRVELFDAVLPALGETPFGPLVKALNMRVENLRLDAAATAPPRGASPPPSVNLDLHWGALHLTGEGSVGLDDDLWLTGQFNVWIDDVLAVLDAVQAKSPLSRQVMATTYARLLQQMATRPDGHTVPFSVDIRDGKIMLLGAQYGLGDIELASVQRPLMSP